MLERYIYSGTKRLRCGYTTGACAAGAAKAAVRLLLTGETPVSVALPIPKGLTLELPVEDATLTDGIARCAVRKDAGDDSDVTDGLLIFAVVSLDADGQITVDGGDGIGRVTRPGLDQPVGAAAINSAPRALICAAVRGELEQWGGTGAKVRIEAPGGAVIAAKTYNPRLGITGGISVLGTTGLVEPMSDVALTDTIRAELSMLHADGRTIALVTPGNYGECFARETLGLERTQAVLCANFLGDAVDGAVTAGFAGMLLVGHAGKLVKLAGGVFNTHSRVADARMEILAAHAALAGAGRELVFRLLQCGTTDEAFDLLADAGLLGDVVQTVLDRMDFHLQNRAGEIPAGAVLFTQTRGLLGMTRAAVGLLNRLKAEEQIE